MAGDKRTRTEMSPTDRYRAHRFSQAIAAVDTLVFLLQKYADRATFLELTSELHGGVAAFIERMAAAKMDLAFIREDPEDAGQVYAVELHAARDALAWAGQLREHS